jgi:hypothetical protein
MPDFQPVDPHAYRVGVVGVVWFSDQHGNDLYTHALCQIGPTADQVPEVVLVPGFAHYSQGFPAIKERGLHAVNHPGGSFIQPRSSTLVIYGLSALCFSEDGHSSPSPLTCWPYVDPRAVTSYQLSPPFARVSAICHLSPVLPAGAKILASGLRV